MERILRLVGVVLTAEVEHLPKRSSKLEVGADENV